MDFPLEILDRDCFFRFNDSLFDDNDISSVSADEFERLKCNAIAALNHPRMSTVQNVQGVTVAPADQ